jgi:hypothetical protein
MKKIRATLNQTWIIATKIWKDPVISTIIATLIIAFAPTIWAIIKQYSILNFYKYLLSLKIPVYIILLSFFVILLIIKTIIYLLRTNKTFWEEEFGEFTFEELYNILKNQNLPVQTNGMRMFGKYAPQENLLIQFCLHKIFLNMGVTMEMRIEDGGYLYGVLCPKMIDYDLVEKIEYKDKKTNTDLIKYQITEMGNRFYRLIEKHGLLNDIKINK